MGRRFSRTVSRPSTRSVVGVALGLVVVASLDGCRGCKNDHPFVPFHIEAGTASPVGPSLDAAKEGRSTEAGPFAPQPSLIAPAHASTWTLGKVPLTAPAGATFRQGLTWDIDGDGHDDALVLVEEAADADARVKEELFFYRGVAEGAPVPARVSLGVRMRPADESLPLDPRCTRIEHLARVGKSSAAVEIGETCPKELAEQGPDRLVALVTWAGSLKTRLAVPVVDPPGAQALTLEVLGTDIDGDGLDDATLQVSLEGGGPPFEPAPPVHAVVRWFDRPAGMSREPAEPERSFHAIAALAAQHATKTKDAASAVALAAAGRFLFQAICAESPVRRVAPSPTTSPIECEAGRALEELGLATTHAHVTLLDPLGAIAALDAAELPPATHTAARVTEAGGWITTLAPVAQATSLRAISAVPRLGPEGASWGALRFEPSGALLVRTLAGVVRVDPLHGDEVEAVGVLAWGTNVDSPDGKQRFEGAFAPCGPFRSSLEASLVAEGTSVDGGDATAVALPVAVPLTPRCGAASAREAVASLPFAWGPAGLELIVAGEPVMIPAGSSKAAPLVQLSGQPVTPGAPRSPDGATFVVPTSQGILVRGRESPKARLFRAKELEHGYTELRDCAVSDDGARVACTRGGIAFVGVWALP